MIRMEVKGLDELERQLTALGEKVATKVLRDAGREALKVTAIKKIWSSVSTGTALIFSRQWLVT